ncbi:LysR family transcriptional regulator [Bradyrhizobium sp. U87765 SZCCT0131]|uniref:LysR family transcriptional regulator n=1 Tax=unclassified Bradyrhizobium TaxID=2631580 RepID=UPI001BAA07D4|nr:MULTISPECIES: LysR family transcriptional regulator [unclassified Bradyrhizobium]MBR1220193.1 LysR family transcriptional regulator [Bradyrhizobium sp. U87765 SZCCT0131]MBR1263351.1 LysR family transcriptional regulator [Bradyrhizobium sp. U87765 SZCCT0134]MBR1306766.1 LysR family transcriptional regulator [Bradyrhizobium sp. U87765 SZCCT0110]MBR1323265.1 LysR family transcriptional regulator [Bradyrhizobium sp. U87765 SZCCT0109]MBR1345720.1 LysR family transcriptional regulator [Bradyrhizo
MDIRQLRHFVAVAETLHFGRAAERLGMTQPPLSQSIMALEQELGSPLFARTKRSVALTPFAVQWLDHVRAALEGVAALPATAQRIRRGETGRLELSFVSTADYSVLPALVRRLRETHPDVELSLTEATSDLQIAALLDGKGHAGIIIAPALGALPEQLDYLALISEPLIAAVPEGWLTSGRLALSARGLPSAAVLSSPLIVFPRRVAPSFYELVTRYYAACGGTPTIAQHAIQMQTIISLVSAGMGIALVPASMRHLARSGVRYVDLQHDAPRLQTGIAWRRDDTSPTLANLLAAARAARVGEA